MVFLYLLIGLLHPTEAKPTHAVIINGSSTKSVYLYYRNTLLDQTKRTLQPKEAISITFGPNAFYPVFVSTPIGDKNGLGVVVFPGDTVHVSYNAAEQSYDFTGSHDRELSFAKRLGTSRFSLVGPYNQVKYDAQTDFEEFLDGWGRLRMESDRFLDELDAAPDIRGEFRAYLEQEIRLRVFSILLIPVVTQKPKEPIRPLPQAYQDTVLVQAKVLQRGRLLPEHSSERILGALRGYLMFLAAREGQYADFAGQYALAKQEYEGLRREWVCYSALLELMKSGKHSTAETQDFQTWVSPASSYRSKIQGLDQLNAVSLQGEAAINDLLIGEDGKEWRLLDIAARHKGKVIYLDLWASWCMPCLQEFPASVAMRQQYASGGLVTIYLSVDEDGDKWLHSAAKHLKEDAESYRFRSWPTSGILSKFRVESIPRYLIIDREGVIRYADAPRPSDPVLAEILERLL